MKHSLRQCPTTVCLWQNADVDPEKTHHLRGALDAQLLVELGCLHTLVLEPTHKSAIQGCLNGGGSH